MTLLPPPSKHVQELQTLLEGGSVAVMVESVDGEPHLPLPTLIECNLIPNNKDEIPTPEAASQAYS